MMNLKRNGSDEQLTLDGILKKLTDDKNKPTSAEIAEAIRSLKSLHEAAEKREQEEIDRLSRIEDERARREEARAQEEHIQSVTSMDLPLDWQNAFACDERAAAVHADSIPDGLILSLSNLGRVDIEYIASVTGEDLKTVICTLRGSIFQNPEKWDECFYKGWETAEEYLSGNLLEKWNTARLANVKYNGYFADNVRAIDGILPEGLTGREIYITLGSPWIPSDVIDLFIRYLFGGIKRTYWDAKKERYVYEVNPEYLNVKHDEVTGSWEIPEKTRYGRTVATTRTWGTERVPALYILEKTLNMQPVQVFDERPNFASGNTVKTLNRDETLTALEIQKKMIKTFQKWVWNDKARKEQLEDIYNQRFGFVRHRTYDGSYLTFPGMDSACSLYPYQKNAVARILYSPNTLLAHDVGSGKTYVMIAAGMELKRMGLSKKNLYVVPNNIVEQWHDIYTRMYPSARIMCVSPKNFTPKKRVQVLEDIRDYDYDGIIMAYSCFDQIPLSKEYYLNAFTELKNSIDEIMQDNRRNTKRLANRLEKLKKQLKDVLSAGSSWKAPFFDELGITRMFVDEAHNYKNLPVETKTSTVLGIGNVTSQKCKNMLDKVRLIQRGNNGGGVIMATGTPITNSITDAYIMQNYLQSGQLALLGLQSFDSWIGMFAEQVNEFEVDVDTSKFRLASRFGKFHNLTELTTLLADIADFHSMSAGEGAQAFDCIPEFDGYTDALIGKTAEFEAYLKNISERADAVRGGLVDRTTDNLLKITSDGRKAALDLRLVKPGAAFSYQSKVARCADNVFEVYCRTDAQKLTQLVFCDVSTPKQGFNMYDELKKRLVILGMPAELIAFIHDYDTESQRTQLFESVRRGEIRVLIGSTFKLGLGVNVQDKLIAVHHLDVPWRPADMVQREGRILRQGNLNKRVYIYRYITEGSFDAYSWQLLETKQRFISELLAGSLQQRNGNDVDDTVLNYAEVKALAIGNPLIKQRVETANELSRLLTLQRKLIDTRLAMQREVDDLPAIIDKNEQRLAKCRLDCEFYKHNKTVLDKAERAAVREQIYQGVINYVLETTESPLLEYQGFTVILPANMTILKPYVYLEREGRYYVELGESQVGALIRIDNFLDSLEDYRTNLEQVLERHKTRLTSLKAELNREFSYVSKIDSLKQKLAKLDKKLGVKNDG